MIKDYTIDNVSFENMRLEGPPILFYDNEIISFLKEELKNTTREYVFAKVILIKEGDKVHLVTAHFRNYHPVIAQAYMMFHKKESICICGGGRIKLYKEDGRGEILDTSGYFYCMNTDLLENIVMDLNASIAIKCPISRYSFAEYPRHYIDLIVKTIDD